MSIWWLSRLTVQWLGNDVQHFLRVCGEMDVPEMRGVEERESRGRGTLLIIVDVIAIHASHPSVHYVEEELFLQLREVRSDLL